jgi:glycosyltransferase involved in cell wall biosynthesis
MADQPTCLLLTRNMVLDGGLPEAVRQLTIANDECADAWSFRVLVQSPFHDEQVPPGLRHSRFARLHGRYLRSVYATWKECRRPRSDYIVASDLRLFLVALAAWTLRFRSPRRVSFWINSVPLVIEGTPRRTIFRIAATFSNLIFVSDAIRRAHSYPRHRGGQRVVYNGIRDLGLVADQIGLHATIVLQYTAAFVDWKNHATLVRAFSRVIESTDHVELRLLGDGPTRPDVEALATEIGVAGYIRFMGARPDARLLLRECDAYVHPSIGEGFGIAVVEAMLAGLPVVANRSGALPEYLVDHETALLVDCNNDDAALARAIEDVIELIGDGRGHDLGNAARAEALKRFSTGQYVASWKLAVAVPDLARHPKSQLLEEAHSPSPNP